MPLKRYDFRCMYVLSIGVSTKWAWFFFVSLFLGIILIALVSVWTAFPQTTTYDFFPAVIIGIIHTVERFYRHLYQDEVFIPFIGLKNKQ